MGTNVELDPVMCQLQSSLLLAESGLPLKGVVVCAGITQQVNSLVFASSGAIDETHNPFL